MQKHKEDPFMSVCGFDLVCIEITFSSLQKRNVFGEVQCRVFIIGAETYQYLMCLGKISTEAERAQCLSRSVEENVIINLSILLHIGFNSRKMKVCKTLIMKL